MIPCERFICQFFFVIHKKYSEQKIFEQNFVSAQMAYRFFNFLVSEQFFFEQEFCFCTNGLPFLNFLVS